MKWWAPLLAIWVWVQADAAEFDFARAARACATGSAAPARDPRILAAIAQAREQHRLFGGQRIDRRGGIVRVGLHEAESDRLEGESTPTWMRVAQFWAALDGDQPPGFRASDGRKISRKRMHERIAGLGRGANAALDADELAAIDSALMRATLVDQPWSAAFISFLMKQAGFAPSEFALSDSHVDYVDQAFAASAAEARSEPVASIYRACDVVTTKPRAGDLICQTRADAAGIASYKSLLEAIEARRRGAAPRAEIAMHCDLVTSADEGGDSKLAAIGGNVFQSVTLREMTLNAGKTLGAKYLIQSQAGACKSRTSCSPNLSRRPWVVLLQFRN
jgi:hypothetical protein